MNFDGLDHEFAVSRGMTMKNLKMLTCLSSLLFTGCVFDTGPTIPIPDQVDENNQNNVNNVNNTNNDSNNTNNENNQVSESCFAELLAASSAATPEVPHEVSPYNDGILISWAELAQTTRLNTARWSLDGSIDVFPAASNGFEHVATTENFAAVGSPNGERVLYFGGRDPEGIVFATCPFGESCTTTPFAGNNVPQVAGTSRIDAAWNGGPSALIAIDRVVLENGQVAVLEFSPDENSILSTPGSFGGTLNGNPSISLLDTTGSSFVMAGRLFSELGQVIRGREVRSATCALPDGFDFVEERVETIIGGALVFMLVEQDSKTAIAHYRCEPQTTTPLLLTEGYDEIQTWDVARRLTTEQIVAAWVADDELVIGLGDEMGSFGNLYLLEAGTDIEHVRVQARPGHTFITGMTPSDGVAVWHFEGSPVEQIEAMTSCANTFL